MLTPPTLTTNTATVTNKGTITGNLQVGNFFASEAFGGNIGITNSGVIGGGVTGHSFGNVALTNAAGATIGSAGINLRSFGTNTATTVGGITTTVFTSGNASAQLDGDVGTTASPGNVNVRSNNGTSTVVVNGLAGNVFSQGGTNTSKTVSGGDPLAASKTGLVTSVSDSYGGLGASSVTIGVAGNVTGVTSRAGVGGSTVTVSGVVGSNGVDSRATSTNFFNRTVVDTNALSAITKQTVTSSNARVGGASLVTIDAGAKSGGSVRSRSDTDAKVVLNGTVTSGDVTATAQTGSLYNNTTTTSYGATSTVTDTKNTNSVNANTASVSIGKSGVVSSGNIYVRSYGGSTFTNSGLVSAGGGGFGNVTVDAAAPFATSSFVSKSTFTSPTDYNSTATTTTVSNPGGAASFTNNAGGYIGGDVFVNGPAGVTIVNAGQVAGMTTGISDQRTDVATSKNSTVDTVAAGITTTTASSSYDDAVTITGGSVSGTYSGTNGQVNFPPTTSGDITQFANTSSTANVTGTVYGGVNSAAGVDQYGNSANNSTFKYGTNTVSTTDGLFPATGTKTSSFVYSQGASSNAGTSTVNVSGLLSNKLGTADVNSSGTTASLVTIGGTVQGDVNSNAAAYASQYDVTGSYDQATTKGVTITSGATDTYKYSVLTTGGVATANVTGTGSVTGDVDVSGVSSASSTVDAGAKVGGSVFVGTTNGYDYSVSGTDTYKFDPTTKSATITNLSSATYGTPLAAGNATATIAGSVGSSVDVEAGRGNATATITGKVGGDVTAQAGGSTTTSTSDEAYASNPGFTGDARTSVGSLPNQTKGVYTTTSTALGGTATILIDTSAALQGKGVGSPALSGGSNSVGGDAFASGLAGASITVTKGSSIGGSATAESLGSNSTSTTTQAFGAKLSQTQVSSSTNVGKAATITNAGTIGDSASADGTTAATVTNTGLIKGSVSAHALTFDTKTTQTDNDVNNTDPSTRQVVTTTVTTPVGGVATVTNGATGVIRGGVFVAGGTGLVTNNGVIVGTTTLGESVPAANSVTTLLSTTTTGPVYTGSTTPFAQTYTVNQNGASGGFNVTGVTDPTSGLATSTIAATINLNNSSVTLGNITAQRSSTGAPLTNTVVNLNGGGFLGLDVYASPTAPATPLVNPEAVLSAQTAALFGLPSPTAGGGNILGLGVSGSAIGVNVTGVTALNKTGAGTFVIVGNAGGPAPTPGGVRAYTLDVGNFNITGGEVQLAVKQNTTNNPTGVNTNFSVNGNINNSATLVLGRRVPTFFQPFGTSLVSPGPEVIQGLTVDQFGNFIQTGTGTLVVGISPTLVRATTVIAGSSVTNEPLGALSPTTVVNYFTTPAKFASICAASTTSTSCQTSTPSLVNVTGNVNLAGKVAVDVNNNGLYSGGDSQVLFNYTGVGTTSAVVTTNVASSPFVGFTLKNDTVAKTISIVVARNSFGTFTGIAGNPNDISGAIGFDSALASAIARIRAGNFASATEQANAQDIANIAALLDFGLTDAQRTEVFNELASGSFYGSLAALDQNVAFVSPLQQMNVEQAAGDRLGTGIWITPSGNWARFDRNNGSGASPLRIDTVGVAGGFTAAYAPGGAIGAGFSYGRHKVHSTPGTEYGRVRTNTVGAFLTQAFGPLYMNAQLEYGWSRFNTTRILSLLARRYDAQSRGHQIDGTLEIGYNLAMGGATITPFANVDARRVSMGAFTEQGPGGIALNVRSRSKSYLMPTVGARVAGTLGSAGDFVIRPYGQASVTFNGYKGTDRTMGFVGGGNDFTLVGVKPGTFGSVDLGFDANTRSGLGFFLAAGYGFGRDLKNTNVRGGVRFMFGGREAAPVPVPVYAPPPPPPPPPATQTCADGSVIEVTATCPVAAPPPPPPPPPPATQTCADGSVIEVTATCPVAAPPPPPPPPPPPSKGERG